MLTVWSIKSVVGGRRALDAPPLWYPPEIALRTSLLSKIQHENPCKRHKVSLT